MTTESIKRVLDAFHLAKLASQAMPLLPEGVTPSYIRFLDIIGKLKREKGRVRVSDLSEALSVQKPGVTRTINEMTKKGYLEKIQSESDGRVIFLDITREGEKLSKRYNEEVFTPLLESLSSVSESDVEILINTIQKFYDAMYTGEKR